MSIFNILSAALVILVLAAGLVLFTGLRAASAAPFVVPPALTAPAG